MTTDEFTRAAYALLGEGVELLRAHAGEGDVINRYVATVEKVRAQYRAAKEATAPVPDVAPPGFRIWGSGSHEIVEFYPVPAPAPAPEPTAPPAGVPVCGMCGTRHDCPWCKACEKYLDPLRPVPCPKCGQSMTSHDHFLNGVVACPPPSDPVTVATGGVNVCAECQKDLSGPCWTWSGRGAAPASEPAVRPLRGSTETGIEWCRKNPNIAAMFSADFIIALADRCDAARAEVEQWKGWTAEARNERDAANEKANEAGCELDGVRAEVEQLRANGREVWIALAQPAAPASEPAVRPLSERMRPGIAPPPVVAEWRDEVAALEAELAEVKGVLAIAGLPREELMEAGVKVKDGATATVASGATKCRNCGCPMDMDIPEVRDAIKAAVAEELRGDRERSAAWVKHKSMNDGLSFGSLMQRILRGTAAPTTERNRP